MVMEKRKHYWNGRWGRLARVDVVLYEDGGVWTVEERIGGVEGRSHLAEYDREDDAIDRVRNLLAGADEWREL
jgi:hypothetical protein